MPTITSLANWRELSDEDKFTLCMVVFNEYKRYERILMLTCTELYHVKEHPDHILFSQASGQFHDWRRIHSNLKYYAEDKNWELALNALGYLLSTVAFLEYLTKYYKFVLPPDTDLNVPWAKCVIEMQEA